MVGRRRREREAAERLAAQRAAAEAAAQRRREAAKVDKERRRRLAARRPWRKVGLSRRWADLLRRAEMALQSAAIAARELVLQSSLTRHDEEAVLDIDSRLRGVSAVLDTDTP